MGGEDRMGGESRQCGYRCGKNCLCNFPEYEHMISSLCQQHQAQENYRPMI